MVILGKIFHSRNKKRLLHQALQKDKLELVIFQIPTVGNVKIVNNIVQSVKNYNLPYKVESWIIVEANNVFKEDYMSDRVIVVPSDFTCEALYKARALEYARKTRMRMIEDGAFTEKYVVLQCDDDALPSEEFILECLQVRADITIGTMCPRPKGFWTTILDYERSVACAINCNFFTNIGNPIWGHGEGMTISSRADKNISYELSGFSKDAASKDVKLISSEDLFYLHKISLAHLSLAHLTEDMLYVHKMALKGYTCYNSEKRIYISPPLTLKDAVKQRRRWLWGHLNLMSHRLLPTSNCVRIIGAELSGLTIYLVATGGIVIVALNLVTIPSYLVSLLWSTLIIWLTIRFYAVRKMMGWKHGIAAVITSYPTVTLNFVIHLIGLLKGDPKRFEVIEKKL